MFVKYVLDDFVRLYNKFFDEETRNNTALSREASGKIREKLRKMIPLDQGILSMVIGHLPSPDQAQQIRYKQFCPALANPKAPPKVAEIREAIIKCANIEAPTIAYVTKMQPFSSKLYDIITKAEEPSPEKQRLIAVTRVFSGCMKTGDKVFVIGPKHMV